MSNNDSVQNMGSGKRFILGLQHVIAMFGATVLVPILTGLDPSVALVAAGLGTLIFHLCTKRKVPVFVGSSFAFIAVIQIATKELGDIRYAQGGIIAAGALYLVFALIVKVFGVNKVRTFFPPIVTGPMIMVIGLSLSKVALEMSSANWTVAIVVIVTVAITSIFGRGFFRIIPILVGVLVGYALSAAMGLIDFTSFHQAALFSIPPFTLPLFSWSAVAIVAPVVLATFMEHIGDITTNGAVVGENFFDDPGLHRTLLGDGLATIASGLIGGPPNTTYGENTSVLAVTKIYDPSLLRLAAMIAIVLGFLGKFGAILQTIPAPVMGGVSVVLFSMITSVGMRTIAMAKVDFTDNRNLLISGLILIIGIGSEFLRIDSNFKGIVGLQIGQAQITGVSLAALVGIIVNKLLPESK